MAGWDNEVMWAQNVDFTGNAIHSETMIANGQLLIANVASPKIRVGKLVSPNRSINVGYTAPNVTIDVASVTPVSPSFPHIQGIAFSKTSNTTTFHSWDGSDLTPANPADVWIQDPVNRALLVNFKIENNFQVVDAGGAGDMNGNSFGTSSGAWSEDMPWFIYVVVNDSGDHGAIALSRVPNRNYAPAVGKCATRTSSVASSQGSFYFLDEVIAGVPTAPTVASYDSNPCICIGSMRAQKASSNNWVIQTPSVYDGIGLYQEQNFFVYPGNQNGATAVTNNPTHWIETAGFPAFSSRAVSYLVRRTGLVNVCLFYTTTTTDGSNANALNVTMPLASLATLNGVGYWDPADNVRPVELFNIALNGGALTGNGFHRQGHTSGSRWNNNEILSGGGSATAQFSFEADYIIHPD